MLETVNLSCARGDRTLFQGLSFSLQPGELLHVLGRNGAGKTTLLRTLCGLTRALDGDVRWNKQDVYDLGDDFMQHIAYIGHLNGVQGEMTPVENLRVHADAPDDALRLENALVRLRLDPFRYFPSKILSQGQKRKLALARLLVVERKLWILDEPFAALDMESVEIAGRMFADHLHRGGMVIMTSHQEVEITGHMCRTLTLDA